VAFVGAASPLTKKGLVEAAAKVSADPIALWVGQPVLALVGGYAVDVVHGILSRFFLGCIDALEMQGFQLEDLWRLQQYALIVCESK
jgi:hypothetical protein